LIQVSKISAFVVRLVNSGGSLCIGSFLIALKSLVESTVSQSALKICHKTFSPTGTFIQSHVFFTMSHLLIPSVAFIAIHLTTPSSRSCNTSITTVSQLLFLFSTTRAS
jgi:hypothetical protein